MTDVDILRGKNIKVGDTLPNLRVKLLDSAGDPFNLSGFTVSIQIRRTDADSLLVDDSATIEDESRGVVEYTWQNGDTDTAGAYLVEFTADDGSNTMSFPSGDYGVVIITKGVE